MSAVEPQVSSHVYRVSPFPADIPEGRLWAVYIWATPDPDAWVVTRHLLRSPREYLTAEGEWTTRASGSIRYLYDTAVDLAKTAVQAITVGGLTVEDAAAGRFR